MTKGDKLENVNLISIKFFKLFCELDGNQNKSPQPIYVKKIQTLGPIDGAIIEEHLTIYGGEKKGRQKWQ